MVDAQRGRMVKCLFERLTDEAPERKSESRDASAQTQAGLRASVLRNLAFLFNAINHEAEADLADFPAITRSVLNFGLPPLAGRPASGLSMRELEREVRLAVLSFEPRLIADTVQVSVVSNGHDGAEQNNTIAFRIDAQLWSQPAPVGLSLHTALNLESGQCLVTETGRR